MNTNWEQHFRQMKPLVTMTNASFGADGDDTSGIGPIESGVGGAILTKDNLDAIQNYFANATPKTFEAGQIKDEFTRWYSGLSWYEKYTQATYDLARNLRNRYDIANATTAAEKQAVQSNITSGISTEQSQGQPDRRDTEGNLPGPSHAPVPSLIPWWVWAAGATVAGLSLISFFYAKGSHVTVLR